MAPKMTAAERAAKNLQVDSRRYRKLCESHTCTRCGRAPARPDRRTCERCKDTAERTPRSHRYRCGQCGGRGHNQRSCKGTLGFDFAGTEKSTSSADVRTGEKS